MVRFHVSPDGTPRKCSATKGKCKYGFNDNEHFSDVKHAQIYVERIMKKRYSNGFKKLNKQSTYEKLCSTENVEKFKNFRDHMIKYYGWDKFQEPNYEEIIKNVPGANTDNINSTTVQYVIDPLKNDDQSINFYTNVIYDNDKIVSGEISNVHGEQRDVGSITNYFDYDDGEYENFGELPCVRVILDDSIYNDNKYESFSDFESRTGKNIEDMLLFPENL